MSSKLIIAAAGSGKTTFLVNEALRTHDGKILITTFTDANEREIRTKFFETAGHIPSNITIMTWFSFLLQQGARPYQSFLHTEEITGLLLVNEQSSRFTKETDVAKHYFTKDGRIYSDKLSKFVYKLNMSSNGLVFSRLSRVYKYIFIDEVQDLSGYDLEIIRLLAQNNICLIMAGDLRQTTYHTHEEKKNKSYSNDGGIQQYIADRCPMIAIDTKSLRVTYRNAPEICDFANSIYPDYEPCSATEKDPTGHDGIFFIREQDLDTYLKKYQPVQLRDTRRKTVREDYVVYNFGDSKGLTFDRIVIYPTKPILKWINNHSESLPPRSRSKFYVAVTRARYSVAIVVDDKQQALLGIPVWQNNI